MTAWLRWFNIGMQDQTKALGLMLISLTEWDIENCLCALDGIGDRFKDYNHTERKAALSSWCR